MDEDRAKRVRPNRSGEIDSISNLPDSLICQILLNIPTKDVVKTSLLSSRWRNLWKSVPDLDLKFRDFPHCEAFVSFVDRFLGFNSDLRLQNFKLKFDEKNYFEEDIDCVVPRWIDTVVNRKVQHLHILDSWSVHMPPTLHTCESLVSLKLSSCGLSMDSPKFVSLPSLKVMDLTIHYWGNMKLETLISGCPVLESLSIDMRSCDYTRDLTVCSQSLLSFTYVACGHAKDPRYHVVAIDAPKLKYLRLCDYHHIANYILNNTGSLVKAYIETGFVPEYLKKINVIGNLLVGISKVKDMVIVSTTLEAFYDYSRYEQLPIFSNLSSLRVEYSDYAWQMLPTFLDNCPNLKSLVLGSTNDLEEDGTIPGPRCFLSSLEYVVIESPLKGEATEMKLVSYLLENSTILKKLILRLDDDSIKKEESAIFKEILTFPRRSGSCQLVIL